MPRRLVAGLLALVLLPAGCSSGPSGPSGEPSRPASDASAPADRAVAEVRGVTVTDAELAARVAMVTSDPDVARAIATNAETGPRLRADVLASMIDAALVARAASRLGVRVSGPDLDAYLERIAARYLGGGADAWARYLDETGYPEEQVRTQLGEDLVRERVEDALGADVRATDPEVRAAYAEGYAGRVRVAHVLVATREEADRLHARLTAGADIADLARSASLDPATAQSGGDLGPWMKGEYTASFDEAVEDSVATGPGILPVVSSPFGWHVVEVRAPATLDEVSDEISRVLVEQRQDELFATWLAGLRTEVPVWVRDDQGSWDAATGAVVTP